MRGSIFALTGLGLLAGVSAWYPCYPTKLTLAQLIGDPQCPSNSSAWHALNEVYVEASPAVVWSIVGNFNNLTWQADTNITTGGIKNAPNDTHTQYGQGEYITEELNIYAGPSSDPPNPTQTLYFMQFHLQPLVHPFAGVPISNVEDLLMAVANGTGTTLSWETSGCSNETTQAAALYSELHQNNINNTNIILQGGQPKAPA